MPRQGIILSSMLLLPLPIPLFVYYRNNIQEEKIQLLSLEEEEIRKRKRITEWGSGVEHNSDRLPNGGKDGAIGVTGSAKK